MSSGAAVEPKPLPPSSTGGTEGKPDVPAVNTKAADYDPSGNQCGLENDGIAWVMNEPPKRKLVCEATPENQAKYREMLKVIFSPVHSLLNRRIRFHPDDIIDICIEVKHYLDSEPVFIEDLEAPITIIGDLHGQLHDLYKIFCTHSVDGKPGYECGRFLFLGNYVERGHQSVEVVIALFILKILYPSEFILLRGNHEFINKNHKEFLPEMLGRYKIKEVALLLFTVFNATFQYLSLCAIVGGDYFCVHGGISLNSFTKTALRNLVKPIMHSTDSYLVQDLVCSDPAEGLRGTAFNSFRQCSTYFGEDVFARAMHAVGCIAMFRGHSRIDDGCEITWERCMTIFSCTDTGHTMNKGSYAKVDKNLRIEIRIMLVDPVRHRLSLELSKADKKTKREEDLGTGTITKMEG